MLVVAITLAAIGLLGFLLWILRGSGSSANLSDRFLLHHADIAAFRNLLSDSDAEYLRSSLSKRNYRKVRRAQLRAVQEYLYWIAEDCAVILALVRADTRYSPAESATIARRAIRLRMIALAYWTLISVRYLGPGKLIWPGRVLGNYEELWHGAQMVLTRYQPQPESSS